MFEPNTYIIVVSMVLSVMEYRMIKRKRRRVVSRCQCGQHAQADHGDLKYINNYRPVHHHLTSTNRKFV